MSGELGDWFADLRSSDPVAATNVGAAVVAATDAADVLDLAVVSQLAGSPELDPADLVAAVEDAEQSVFSALSLLREQVAEAGSYRSTTRTRITPHGSYPHPFTAAEVADLARREQELTDRMRSCQGATESFRARVAAARGRRMSSAAMRDIQLTMLAATDLPTVERAAAHADLAAAEASLARAEAELTGLLAEAAVLRRSFIRAYAGTDTADPGDIVPGLLELHADPVGTDIRILLGVEPADTVTLLAVLDSPAAVSEHRALAVKLAGELLAELRTDGWPEPEAGPDQADAAAAAELTFDDAGAFLARYFPDSEADLRRRSASLAAAGTLARMRRERRLSLADLAARTGLAARDLRRLETGELTAAQVGDVAAYVRALGGRLRMRAEFDGEQQVLS